MKNQHYFSILFFTLFFACSDSTNSDTLIKEKYSTHVEEEVESRFDFINTYLFQADSSLFLTEEQKTKLFPILAEKVILIEEIEQLVDLDSNEKRKRKKEIRKNWHPKIDAVLNPNQIKMRHQYLNL